MQKRVSPDIDNEEDFGLGLDISYVPKEKKRKIRDPRKHLEIETVESTKGDTKKEGSLFPERDKGTCHVVAEESHVSPSSSCEEASAKNTRTPSDIPTIGGSPTGRKKTVYEMERDEKLKSLLLSKREASSSPPPPSLELENMSPSSTCSPPPSSLTPALGSQSGNTEGLGFPSFVRSAGLTSDIPFHYGEGKEGSGDERARSFSGRGAGRGRSGRGGRGEHRFSSAFTTHPSSSSSTATRRPDGNPEPDARLVTFRLNQRRIRNALVEVDIDSRHPVVMTTAPGSGMTPSSALSSSSSSFPSRYGSPPPPGGGSPFFFTGRGRGGGGGGGGAHEWRHARSDGKSFPSSLSPSLPQQQHHGNTSISTIAWRGQRPYGQRGQQSSGPESREAPERNGRRGAGGYPREGGGYTTRSPRDGWYSHSMAPRALGNGARENDGVKRRAAPDSTYSMRQKHGRDDHTGP